MYLAVKEKLKAGCSAFHKYAFLPQLTDLCATCRWERRAESFYHKGGVKSYIHLSDALRYCQHKFSSALYDSEVFALCETALSCSPLYAARFFYTLEPVERVPTLVRPT